MTKVLSHTSIAIVFMLIMTILPNKAFSESRESHCDLGFGWHFYCDEATQEEASQNETEENEIEKYKAELKRMQEELEGKKVRAIVNPTPEHVKDYITYQNKMLNQSSKFTDIWRRVVWSDPQLDYSLKVPTNTMAKHKWIDEKSKNTAEVLIGLNKRYGLFFIYRSNCPYCHKYSPIIKNFGEAYNIDIIPITADGKFLKGWENSTITDLSVINKLGIGIKSVPATILYDNQEKEVIPIGFGVLSKSDLENRIYTITTLKINEAF